MGELCGRDRGAKLMRNDLNPHNPIPRLSWRIANGCLMLLVFVALVVVAAFLAGYLP